MTGNRFVSFLITLLIAVVGGLIFQWVHMPIPWLLGPMMFVLIVTKLWKSFTPFWPGVVRNSGMIMIGYTIGLSFTMEAMKQIGQQLPLMILLTALLLLGSTGIAFLVSKFSGISFPTVLMGSIPGGLTQMIPLAEEIKGVDLTVVTFLQVSRLLMIIFFVPLLVFSPFFGLEGMGQQVVAMKASASWSGLYPHIFLFAAACTAGALLGKKIHLPSAIFLGPMIVTILINLNGYEGPALPSTLLNVCQLMIGGYIGLLLKPEQLKNKLAMAVLAILSGAVLISCSLGLSYLLTLLHPVPFITAFLGLSPGGMDQMGIIAKEVDADLSVVICYQLFRTLFIFLVVPSLIKFIFRSRLRSNVAETTS
ncbi:AbrB family transcriptional regulator [Brevibacillus choshinensis]|uniref:AbrB family transcriptional regulator n=1 Tax=Brevibacillus choshinensis TaxID=54911 RepID=A0ABR5N2N8_BRECH|nr:AbrB family transcriptional regulator [Brevibacillus choshinensis]KQL44769.1 AbrB family transcriptional regulator [Brevibacillus choshinensis]